MIEISDTALALRAARLYYDDGKTQDEIGDILGITRWKAGRLLALARESGIVAISIVDSADDAEIRPMSGITATDRSRAHGWHAK